MKFLWCVSTLTNCLKVRSDKSEVRTKTCDTYYVNNSYTNVTKVYEEYIEFRTGSNHKKCRKTKNKFSKRIGRTYRLKIMNKIMATQE